MRASAADLWGSAEYERLALRLAPVHEELVDRLRPAPGEPWLDVASGTGAIALRAAQAGADVTGIDIAPALVEQARAKAGELPVRFEIGDAQALPYRDGAFEVVVSCFGAIFAPDHEAVASGLARVCRGRLGLTAWRPNAEIAELYGSFGLEAPEGVAPYDWGRDGYAEALLGGAFAIEAEPRVWLLEGGSGEEIWELWSTSAPLFKALVASLDHETRGRFRDAYVGYCERYRDGDRVAVPREYLLILGRRR